MDAPFVPKMLVREEQSEKLKCNALFFANSRLLERQFGVSAI